ncbi:MULTISPECIES: DoxX family protein [unclassified Ornithinimicrobium]|uniref:DoxX family protein n=1 Tax=unclassified Ornithinimicrobium TaxID=2615080 RepID=UPI0038546E7B
MHPRSLPLVIVPFSVSGVVHLLRPRTFEPIVPRPLRPWARELVLVSGAVELACAAGLLHPRTRSVAGPAAAALLLAVWPANAQMSLDLHRRAVRRRDTRSRLAYAVSLLRLPLQVPLVRIAWAARRAPGSGVL